MQTRHPGKIRLYLIHFVLYGFLISVSVHLYIQKKSVEKDLHRLTNETLLLRTQIKTLKKEKHQALLLKKYIAIEKKIEAIRGIWAKTPIEYNTITKTQFEKFILKKFDEEYPEETFHDMENALKTIGLINEKVNLKDIILKVYKEQVAAFYDYEKKQLFILENNLFSGNITDMFIAHEIVHALQDQNFDLQKMGIGKKDNDDEVLAVTTLIEGDATYCMNRYYTANINPGILLDVLSSLLFVFQQEEFEHAPLYVRENLMFPYLRGLAFVSEFYKKDAKITINQAFEHPPQSSEQVLHIEKYISRETPTNPDMPDLAGFFASYNQRIIAENVLGELNFQILLKQKLPANEVIPATTGWGGDRYVVFENVNHPDDRGFIILSRWDSPQDAREFFDAFLKWVKKMYSVKAERINDTETGRLCVLDIPDQRKLSIVLDNSDCSIILSKTAIHSIIKSMLFTDSRNK